MLQTSERREKYKWSESVSGTHPKTEVSFNSFVLFKPINCNIYGSIFKNYFVTNFAFNVISRYDSIIVQDDIYCKKIQANK